MNNPMRVEKGRLGGGKRVGVFLWNDKERKKIRGGRKKAKKKMKGKGRGEEERARARGERVDGCCVFIQGKN